MSAFLEERLPVNVRIGASFADDYNVEISRTAGGREYRRIVHPFPSRRFRVSFTAENADLYNDVLALYHRAYGKYAGFRVKAINDWSTNGTVGTPTALDQELVLVSAGVYQLVKAYGTNGTALSGVGYPYRKLFKPVSGTVLIAVAGVPQASGWTVDTTTGLVTFAVDPGAAMVTGGCQFDIPCRFDSAIDVTPVSPVWAETSEIDLVELIDL